MLADSFFTSQPALLCKIYLQSATKVLVHFSTQIGTGQPGPFFPETAIQVFD